MKKMLSVLIFPVLLATPAGYGQTATSGGKMTGEQNPPEQVVRLFFRSGEDTLYVKNNEAGLERLYTLADEHRQEIVSGRIPVYVDGYCASMSTARENINTAYLRANRVKSELIIHKGMTEDNFITANYPGTYTGPDGTVHKDIVVVTFRIPAKAEEPKPQPEPAPEFVTETKPGSDPEQKPEPEYHPEPQHEPAFAGGYADRRREPYCFAVRTNLLYDAFLIPTLGMEWRAAPGFGVKLDGSYSHWGNRHGRVQKIWLISPEVRWYMGGTKRFYLGLGGNAGEYNIYRGPVGEIFSKDTGYQGRLWNAGVTVGYQLYLSRGFSLDFNLGLGYTNLRHDSFNMIDGVRVYKKKKQSRNFWGPTQAGVSLIWTIGGNK